MKVIIIIFLLSISSFCGAQQYDLPDVNGRPFFDYLHTAFRENGNKLDTLELRGICWVKFMIGKDNSVLAPEVSPGVPAVLSSFLEKVILEAGSKWLYDIKNKWLILPVAYTLHRKGRVSNLCIDSNELHQFFCSRCRNFELPVFTCIRVYNTL